MVKTWLFVIIFRLPTRLSLEQLIAAKHPERVNGLMLHVGFHRVPFLQNAIWSLMWKIPAGRKMMMKSADFLFKQRYPPTPESFARQGIAPLKFDGRKLLGQVKAPTLIVNGTKDQAVSMRITRELARGIPGAKLVLVDGDHLFIAQDVDLLIKPALEFLIEIDGGSTTKIAK